MYEAFDIEHLKELIRLHNQPEIEQTIKTCLPADLADLLSDLSEKDQKYFFEILPSDVATKVFEFLDPSTQLEILKLLSASEVSNLLNAIAPDDRTAFLEKLPPKSLNEYLRLLSPPEQSVALKLLGYPENSVGRLMTPDFLAVRKEWSVKQVLDYIRAYGHDSETINLIYVVDEKGKLLDDIKIKEFLFVSPTYKVSDLMDNSFIALNVTDDQEVAVNSFKKNNRGALPVIDSHGILKGIVTIDDVLFVAEEEDTEDIQKIGGVEALEDPYMESPLLLLIRKRAFWLVILFVGELFTASAMAFFEEDIAKAVALALFVPLIISSGGNSGSQASSLIIRALALGEITLRDWWKVMGREIISGLLLGSVLAVIGFIRIGIWTLFTDIYGPHWFLLALTVSLSLIGVVTWGTIMGSMLPLLIKRLGGDPALSSAPFVATLVDVSGIIIYFSIALLILKGIML
ncbi:magnesium transporter mgtE [Parachlamydia acanthamoebae UV-7]|jgi:magnesium transporter|uniref:Magnesium transporter MgtE n=2 Tax=Parachlamydia acanthamoebae TaxID=83552 RepID=F8KZ97_PARAV|nr:magnesium transporter [Parachlamydia acanthamoebae]KIA78050.1 Magnesium transporter MgtE [Parachlamydia acanthamoebae]CCB86228.1 magnesium transporter mgtE [Parachlamydia acanthamoebae UV-7]